MTPMEPVFMDPPPVFHADDNKWQPTIDALKAQPGKWAVICEGSHSTTGNLASRVKARRGIWAAGQWEVTTRRVPDSRPETIRVFARYMPDADETSEAK